MNTEMCKKEKPSDYDSSWTSRSCTDSSCSDSDGTGSGTETDGTGSDAKTDDKKKPDDNGVQVDPHNGVQVDLFPAFKKEGLAQVEDENIDDVADKIGDLPVDNIIPLMQTGAQVEAESVYDDYLDCYNEMLC